MSNEKKQESCRQPIGVFDSGMGGISVLRELVKVMPHEDFIYFGDSVNAPYGTRPTEQIRDLTIHHVESLMAQEPRGCGCMQYGNECGSRCASQDVSAASSGWN